MPAESGSALSRGSRVALTVLLLAGGAALLVWQIGALDLSMADLREAFAVVGVWFLAILALSLGRFVLRSYAWIVLTGRPLNLATVVAATVSGDALGNVTPLGLLASEPAKAIYLRREIDTGHALAALTAENFFYSVSVAIWVIVATAAMLLLVEIDPTVFRAAGVAAGGMVVVLAAAAWLAWRRPSFAAPLVAWIPSGRLGGIATRVRLFERAAYEAGRAAGSRMAAVAACEAGFHVLSLIECWLTYWLLTGVTSWLPALIFDGFNRVVNVVFKPVPLRLGVEEGGTALLAVAIGQPSHAGFLLGMIRKARVIVWAAIGLALWGSRGLAGGRAAAEGR
jgi:hypothetical protein